MPPTSKAAAKPAGAPTWMVTFGDLMSLLFSLFVLLFTYSTLDVEKYKALAGSLREAFGSTKSDALIGDLGGPMAIIDLSPEFSDTPGDSSPQRVVIELKPQEPKPEEAAPTPVPPETGVSQIDETDVLKAATQSRERRAEKLEQELSDAVTVDLSGARIDVERKGDRVMIRFPNEIAYPAGSAEITEGFAATLKSLTKILSKTPGKIVIGGHTDNVPIAPGGRYQSNWELSAGRAAAVVHVLLEDKAIVPERVTIQGFGDSRPRVENDTREHRAMNRRVEISILIDQDVKNGEKE